MSDRGESVRSPLWEELNDIQFVHHYELFGCIFRNGLYWSDMVVERGEPRRFDEGAGTQFGGGTDSQRFKVVKGLEVREIQFLSKSAPVQEQIDVARLTSSLS